MRRLVLLFVTLFALAFLAACGGDGNGADQEDTATGAHNAADIAFAQRMIPHHRQAIEMADLASTRARDARVSTMARQIRATQEPQIATMTGWLTAWGRAVAAPAPHSLPGTSPTSAPHSDHTMSDQAMASMTPGGDMDGMMSVEDMTALRNARGSNFDELFLAMMIEHHQGAVSAAAAERRDGIHPPARQLAEDVQRTQTTEISDMQSLLTEI
ncbi:DUF305 domain-containing protein [Frankia sp. AgKG'84/4]|uniref:DUF305 domain-containing protein n=1 Tax=Frankia sp. AgKG'84/4 TaxID=573490 RepID=UPI002029DEA2|nr:DUF305 domain-containing protein [Frankia sp. AgKG'84/4]MCL9794151.1 DUF305 domain-containing protein [Frankia sp. AgKG'84/4]